MKLNVLMWEKGFDFDEEGKKIACEFTLNGTAIGYIELEKCRGKTARIKFLDMEEQYRYEYQMNEALKMMLRKFDLESAFVAANNQDEKAYFDEIGKKTKEEPWIYLDEGLGVYELNEGRIY